MDNGYIVSKSLDRKKSLDKIIKDFERLLFIRKCHNVTSQEVG